MRITLDEKENVALASNPDTIGAVLLDLTALLQSRGRAIQSVTLDGQDIAPEAMTPEWGTQPLADFESLEVATASITDLALATLDEIAAVIPELPTACHELAQILTGDTPSDGFGHFNQLLEIWEVLKEREHQVAGSLGLDLSTVTLGSETALEHDARLQGVLTRACAFMESSQFVELADLLSHDLIDMAEAESDLIESLRTAGQS